MHGLVSLTCQLVPCRYGLKSDVRESLYDYCNQWVEAIGSNRKFMGGSNPNLADLVSNNLWCRHIAQQV